MLKGFCRMEIVQVKEIGQAAEGLCEQGEMR